MILNTILTVIGAVMATLFFGTAHIGLKDYQSTRNDKYPALIALLVVFGLLSLAFIAWVWGG